MNLLNILIILITLSCFTSCSNYLKKIYRQMDREGDVPRRRKKRDKFALYRRRLNKQKSSKHSKRTNPNQVSSSNFNYMPPSVRRQYHPQQKVKKRYTASDLNDNSAATSLWTGHGRDGHLFTHERKKQSGDIIIINILSGLKNKITAELKRAFPTFKRKNTTKAKSTEDAVANATPKKESTEDTNKNKIYDKISSIVIEQINKDHLLLRGRKDVYYKKRKRTIEVQALIARTSISTTDTINSINIIESNIEVLR